MKKPKKNKSAKKPSRKTVIQTLWNDPDGDWIVVLGRLVPGRGRPSKTGRIFQYVAEKLPYASLNEIKKRIQKDAPVEGVYLAHDSMGTARYGGRGRIFSRLSTHKRKYVKELTYFSFYVIKDKKHEREIETAILRAAGPQMILNQRKVRDGIDPGNIGDYEPGTFFFERQYRKGKKKGARKKPG